MAGATTAIRRVMDRLAPEERAQLESKLDRVLRHRRAIQRFPTPGHFGQFMRPSYLQTPMLDAVDAALVEAEHGAARRWLINTPPQEGKTTRLQDFAGWLLLRDPTLRIGFASYEQGIAARSGLEVRQMIEAHGSGYRGQRRDPEREDVLGLLLDPDRAMQTSWSLADVPGRKGARPGGIISVGVGSALTGRPLDVLIVDDPIKDAHQADSTVYRQRVKDWFQSVANTRIAGRNIIIVIQTRWHEDDLTGWLIAEDDAAVTPQYRRLNIRAQAEDDDPLGRAPGEYLISARGRSTEEWEQKKIDVGTRWWYALYQGRPSPPGGKIFQMAWFDKHRVAFRPELVYVATYVDPADNDGGGDEAGICTAGLGADGNVYILADDSGTYTVAGWVRAAVFALLSNDGSRLCYEQSLSGLKRSIIAEWKMIRREATALREAHIHGGRWRPTYWPPEADPLAIEDAHAALVMDDDTPEERAELQRRLLAIWPYVPRVLDTPRTGPPTRRITARGSKSLRADMVSPLFENGVARMVGHHPAAEHQMVTWQPTQDSPDRMDAIVHAVTDLSKNRGVTVEKPTTERQLPGRQRAMPQILRTTRRPL